MFMYFKILLTKHFKQVKEGGIRTILKKLTSLFFVFVQLPIYLISIPTFVIIILVRPWYLIRWNVLNAGRIGHFALYTELYCCERDAKINLPKQRYKDLFYLSKVSSNRALEKMWSRSITILPRWLLKPIHMIGNFFYSTLGKKNIHEINSPANEDRDIHNLLEKFSSHIRFTEEEENNGKNFLEKLGLPPNAKFVCLIVRDAGYLKRHEKTPNDERWSYHNYRDGDIEKYVVAAEELASRGYYVFRMGINVLKPLKSANPKVIDYANIGIRSDFIDVYLGAKCSFCVSTACGFDAVPAIFRRPIAFIAAPIGSFFTSNKNFLLLTKHHINKLTKKELSISEIFLSNVSMAWSAEVFKDNNIELRENTPDEIRDLVIEMDERISGNWRITDEDSSLQNFFWLTYEKCIHNLKLYQKMHGKIKAKFSARYLRNNKNFIN